MAGKRPFRFGIMEAGNPTREEWIEQVRRAEALGYSTYSIGEHIFTGLPVVPTLAAAAMVTSTLRVGSMTFGNDFRNPVWLARDAAAIDLLSDGRLELGLGTGYLLPDYRQTGIPLDAPKTRVDRLVEAVALIKRAFTEEVVEVDGEHYCVRELKLLPKPVQRPWPPLLVGGGGKRMLSFAGREADIVSIGLRSTPDGGFDWNDITAEATERKVGWAREGAGERWGDIEVHQLVNLTAVTDDPEGVARAFLDGFPFKPPKTITPATLLAAPNALVGTVDEIAEMLVERRERHDSSYITVYSTAMDAFAPVVQRLAGT